MIVINHRKVDFNGFEVLEQLQKEFPYIQSTVSFLSKWFDSHPNIQLSSSGTTGVSKSIVVSKQSMIQSALRTQKAFGYQEGDTALLCLSAEFIAGQMMLVRAIVSQLMLIIEKPSSRPLENQTEKIDFLPMTPMQLETTIQHEKVKLDLVKTILLGGAAINERLIEQLTNISPEIYLGFGMTETLSHIALRKIYPTLETKYEVLNGVELGIDDRNCLVISVEGIDDPIVTNDLVDLHNDGTFTWLGRFDNIINSGGIKIFPEKLESLFKSQIEEEVYLSSRPSSLLGEELVLVSKERLTQDDLLRIQNAILSKYNKFHIPKGHILITEFPKTETGKIRRAQLKDMISDYLDKQNKE